MKWKLFLIALKVLLLYQIKQNVLEGERPTLTIMSPLETVDLGKKRLSLIF